MHLEVTFRNLNAREEVKKRAQALFKKLDRFLDAAAEANLVVSVDHGMTVVEVVVSSRGQTFKAMEEDEDLRTALDRVMHTVEEQLRRAKDLRTSRRRAVAGEPEFGGPIDAPEPPPVAEASTTTK